MSSMNRSDKLNNNLETWRILAFGGILILVFGIYLTRMFIMQVVEGSTWQAMADENRIQIVNQPAQRGIIYDRNGYVLARNIPSYNVVITPVNLPDDPGETQAIYRALSKLIDVPVSNSSVVQDDPNYEPYKPCASSHGITQIVEYGDSTAPFSPVKIKCDIDRDLALSIQEKAVDWPGVGIEVSPIRDYPTGYLTADVIGYLGPISADLKDKYESLGFDINRDKIGYAGLERTFQEMLAGRNGKRTVEWDAAGAIVGDVKPVEPAQPGLNLRTTIDTRLQQEAYSILTDEINDWNLYFRDKPARQMTSGVAIAMNPKTGEILAMVSWPTYENNRMARFIPEYYYKQLEADKRKPLVNHALGDELPAGSVFKLSTAVGALNEGVVKPDQIVQTPGKITIEERSAPHAPVTYRDFVDWNNDQTNGLGFGELPFPLCIAYSSNVCFYKVGGGFPGEIENGGLGICRLGAYARALGYGDYPHTGLDDEEVDGLVPDPQYKRETGGESWTLGDTYIVSVGQGYVLATPLQVLQSAAVIANRGVRMQSTLVRDWLDGEGNVVIPFKPKVLYDLTKDNKVEVFDTELSIQGCETTNTYKNIAPWVFDTVRQGMRQSVLIGTLSNPDKIGFNRLEINGIAVAGKTGTAEYCDEFARAAGNPCSYGNWPTHAWALAFAPFDDPEIAVVAFVYNGGEGASTAAPIVRRIMESYFSLKAIDNGNYVP